MPNSIAALPMYNAPELEDANSQFWNALAKRLRTDGITDVPDELTRPADLQSLWSSERLLLAQTCGYPLTHGLCGDAALIATPVYDVAHVDGPYYGSAIIVSRACSIETLLDARNHVAAINGYDSNTGMNLFRVSLARAGARNQFFSKVIVTGAHRASVKAIISGEADIASIDVVSLAHFISFTPAISEKIRIIGYTPKTPGLPFITNGATSETMRETLRSALASVVQRTPRAPYLDKLKLKEIVTLPRAAYDVIKALEEEAKALGYPTLQ